MLRHLDTFSFVQITDIIVGEDTTMLFQRNVILHNYEFFFERSSLKSSAFLSRGYPVRVTTSFIGLTRAVVFRNYREQWAGEGKDGMCRHWTRIHIERSWEIYGIETARDAHFGKRLFLLIDAR